MSFKEFFDSYLETALWSSTSNTVEDHGEPLDKNFSVDDFAPETLVKLRIPAVQFYERFQFLWGSDSQAGHDFWLTQNGHGAGFWDGDYPEHGDKLTEACKHFPSVYLYIGDDGKVHA